MVGICHGQNHSGGVAVAVRGVSAVFAPENSFPQPQALLGYRVTHGAGHGGVGRRHQHHLPARPHTTFDQFPFSCTDRGVGRLSSHRGTGQELRLEVLHRDGLVIGDHATHPLPRDVDVLPGGFLVQLRRRQSGSTVALRRGLSASTAASGHLPLRSREFGSAPPTVTAKRQVVGGVGRGGRGSNTPVDTDATLSVSGPLGGAANNERGVPVPEAVLIDTDTGRIGRQLPRPHHGDDHAVGQAKSTISEGEAPGGVLQRRQRLLTRLDPRLATPTDLVRVVERGGVSPQRLLLRNLGTHAQPRERAARFGEQLRQLEERGLTATPLLVHGFVPQIPAAVPLLDKRALRDRAWAQPVVVAHCLDHTFDYTAAVAGYGHGAPSPWRSSSAMCRTNATLKALPYLPMAKARGFSGAFR